MPGTLTLRPLTANLTRDTEFFGTMDPYCKVILGNQKLSGQVCRNGGKHPSWDDSMILRRVDEPCFHLELKEKDWLLPDGTIGACDVNLREVEAQKRVLKWYPLVFENKPVGKILLEINYEPDHQAFIHEALPANANNNVLNERVNQQPKPKEEQPSKIGFLQGIIHGWTPFGSKSQQQPISEPKQEAQAPVVAQKLQHNEVPVPAQQIYNSYPLSGQVSDYDQNNYIQQSKVYQENRYVPQQHIQGQEQNDYPQKYPQFSPQQSMNIDSNYQGAYYPNPNPNPVYVQQVAGDQHAENRDVYNQRNEEYGSTGKYLNEYYGNNYAAQDSQDQNINKFDPLNVIRGL